MNRQVTDIVKAIREETQMVPKVALTLGSGLGGFAAHINVETEISYRDLPGFPVSTAPGHDGRFIFGTIGEGDHAVPVVCMKGRIHFYEGYPMDLVTLPIRVMKVLGISYLFVSNAAGGINFDFKVGDLMIIKDHINMITNPLIGPNMDEFGPRFPDMTHPYDARLIAKAKEIAEEAGISLREGVYIASSGPSYETPAEWHFFRTIGADAAGMSTVPEVIVARHSEIPVFGMSVITNAAQKEFAADYKNDGDDVVKAADAAADKMTYIFTKLIEFL